jgi:hypothetical protein
VNAAAASAATPLDGNPWGGLFEVTGAPPRPEAETRVHVNFVTAGWFSIYGTRLVAGRDVEPTDRSKAPLVALVNEAFVRKFLPGKNPVGATVAFERGRGAPVPKTVVGVVGDAVYTSLRSEDVPTQYTPLPQADFPGPTPTDMTVSVRAAAGPPTQMARSIAAALAAMDRDLVFGFRAMTDQVSASLTQERLVAMLSAFFGVLALSLAGLGLYGMTSYAVACRRAEIGIRIALGSTGARVVGLVVSRAAWLVTAGILIGGGVSAWASKFVATLLYQLDPRDPLTLISAGVMLVIVGTGAAWVPAYRASRLDPATVLRET